MSSLFVDSIKDKSNTKTLATLSSSAVTLDSSVVFPAGGTGNPISVAVICDQKTSGTAGGTFSNSAWRVRDLNTEISDPDSIVSISSNQFTLTAGTYLINWIAPCQNVGAHKSKLYNITGSADLAFGSSEYTGTGTSGHSFGGFIHSPSGSNVYEIRHQCATTNSGGGFGVATSFAVEIYTIVTIQKLK